MSQFRMVKGFYLTVNGSNLCYTSILLIINQAIATVNDNTGVHVKGGIRCVRHVPFHSSQLNKLLILKSVKVATDYRTAET
jgi:hypothetical protein